MTYEDTIILLGDSPFIGEVTELLPYVLDKYASLGINRIINSYETTYQVFTNDRMLSVANSHCDIPAISLYRHGDLVQTKEKELYDSFPFNFDLYTEKDILKNGKLAWCGFTHDFAISYLIVKGWKNIILIGAADFSMGASHYSVNMAFTPSYKLFLKSKRYIEEICTKRANIVTCNPNSALNIPRISIEELL